MTFPPLRLEPSREVIPNVSDTTWAHEEEQNPNFRRDQFISWISTIYGEDTVISLLASFSVWKEGQQITTLCLHAGARKTHVVHLHHQNNNITQVHVEPRLRSKAKGEMNATREEVEHRFYKICSGI